MSFASNFVGLMKGIFGLSPNAAGGIVIPNVWITSPPPLQIGGDCGFYFSGSYPYGVYLGATMFNWSNTCFALAGTNRLLFNDQAGDIGITRLAPGVLSLITSNAGAAGGWLQNTGGRGCTTADATNATAAMANIDGTKFNKTLIAGRKYAGFMQFFASNTTGAEGLQFDFAGGTATFTDFRAGFSGSPVGATLGVNNSNSNATALTATAVSTSDVLYEIGFNFVCNAGGTFIPRFAEVSHTTGTATIRKSAALIIEDMP